MKKKEIIKELEILKEIEPDPGFVKSTRKLILTAKPHTRFVPVWATGLALAAVMLILVASGIILSTQQPTLSSSLNQDFLAQEFNEMDINLEIEEITYSQDVHETIASALNEISGSKTDHMNPSVLEAEKEYINQLKNTNNEEEINNLLNKVLN